MALEVAQMEEDPVGGSSSAAVAPHRVRREPPPSPLSGGNCSPARGEPPLQWMAAQDPTSALFSLDDHSESMEREGLDIGISTMLNALDQARGALREIVIPTTQVFAGLFFFLRMFLCFRFSDTSLLLLQILVARSRKKSQFLREQKAERDRLSEEAWLRPDMATQLATA